MIIAGLLILVVAAGLGVAGVAANTGSAHSTGINFDLLGLHLNGLSTGQVFLFGIVVGAVGMLGLSILLGAFTRRAASSRSRRELNESRHETAAIRSDRDRVTRQLDDEHTERLRTATSTGVGTSTGVDTATAADTSTDVGPSTGTDTSTAVGTAPGVGAGATTHPSPPPGSTNGTRPSGRTPVLTDPPRWWDRLRRPTDQ
jgi:hypothetical protein